MSSKQRFQPKKNAFSAIPGARWLDYFPGFIEPCHPTLQTKNPDGDRWLHELKVDGYRCQLHLWHGGVAAYTRRGNDWAERFASIVEAAKKIEAKEAVIDGELVVMDAEGVSDFGALQTELAAKRSDKLTYVAFDLLYADGYDLRPSPLEARKEALQKLIATADSGRFLYSQHVIGSGPAVHAQACKMGVEGVVSKLRDAPYRSGRTDSWIKATCRKRDTFTVVAFVPGTGVGTVGALYLGRREGGALLYAGKAGTGFTGETARMLRERLEPIAVRKSPLTKPMKKPKAHWVKPEMLVDVEYRAVTADGRLRHASFKGVREDLSERPKRAR